MKNTKKLVLKIVLWTLGSFVGLFLLLWGGLNIAKFFIYSEYYDIKREICKIPGISDGLVCQGLCATDRGDRILVSGYMNDGSASRIYITNLKGESHYVTLTKKGEDLYGHVGGIACHGNTVYLVDDSTLYAVTLSELVNSKEGDSIDLSASATVNNDASFCYADDEYVYVGEFHDGKNYFTDHPYDTDDGTYYAIMSRYKHSDLTKPDKVYSIRNKVQGMCMTDEGKIVLSTSYGLSDSVYYVYDESKAVNSGKTLDGAPVYYLCEYEKTLNGPAMAEGLDFLDGEVITLTESATNKYIFGKFFFANKIVGLDIE